MDCEGAEYELLRTVHGPWGDFFQCEKWVQGGSVSERKDIGLIDGKLFERKIIQNPSKGLWKWFELNGRLI